MRDLRMLNKWRHKGLEAAIGRNDDPSKKGAFFFKPKNRRDNLMLRVIASAGDDWDHVSVSTESRCPTWEEMAEIKRLFFNDDECAVEYHVPTADHINVHPYTLHLWRPVKEVLPRPPGWMIA